MSRLFGTDGIRGPAGIGKLAPPALARLGLAIAEVITRVSDRPRALIGRDTRISGPSVAGAVTSGLLAGGVEVHDGGVLPTPAVAMLTRRRKFSAGIVVSASHNPWRDNGLKLLGSSGAKIADKVEAAIEKAYAREGLLTGTVPEEFAAPREYAKAREHYVDGLVKELANHRLRGLSVIVDAANGAQCGLATRVLRRLGAKVTAIHDKPDGRNINAKCGALDTRSLARAVRKQGADAGIAFDGDADRLQLVNERGKLLDGDAVLAALAPRRLAARRLPHRTVVGTVMTNGGLEAYLAENGIALARTAVGDRNIVSEMSGRGYGLGGEPSGHLIVPRRGLLTGDALYAAVLCLHVLVDESLAASELRGGFRPWPLELVSFRIRERVELRKLPRAWKAIRKARESLGDQGRVVVRYSGTEPKVRVMVEARKRGQLAPALDPIVTALRREVGAK